MTRKVGGKPCSNVFPDHQQDQCANCEYPENTLSYHLPIRQLVNSGIMLHAQLAQKPQLGTTGEAV